MSGALTSGTTPTDLPVNTQASPDQGAPQQQSVQADAEKSGVNLFTLPEFRSYQAKMDRQFDQLKREIQTRDLRLKELETKDMSELDRYKYELAEAQAALEEIQERQREAEFLAAKQRDVERFAKLVDASDDEKFKEKLWNARSYDEAMEITLERANSKQTRVLEKEQERRDANQPYLATGAPSTPTTRREQAIKEAKEKQDGYAMIKALLLPSD